MSKASALAGNESRPGIFFTGFVLVVLCGGLAYLVSSGWTRWFAEPVLEARIDTGCELHYGPCSAWFDDGARVTLDIEPRSIRPMQPLSLSLSFEGVEVENVSVDFQGVRMNMGQLNAEVMEVDDGRFEGSTVLPVCIRKKMTWSARVSADSAQGVRRANFEFDMFSRFDTGP